ncbi:MAG TPA: trypsin-like peptidase domain-containing protein [Nocardioides sp.]|uniref:S1C family serine protease n=1 Tax=Nocardioides sp. TaxID=35761 RepID=UPI002ED87143
MSEQQPTGEPTEPRSWDRPIPATPPPPPPGWSPYDRTVPLQPPQPPPPSQPARGRVSGWVWPAVTVLALLVGGIGGVAGGALWERYDDDPTVSYVGGTGAPVSPAPIEAEDASVPAVAQALLPSTVQIVAEFEDDATGATGSGFVFDDAGHVVTNNHVVADAAADDGEIVVVDHEGNRLEASVVGRSPVYDLAVLAVPEARGLKPAALGASAALRVGEQVVAIGSPLGLSSTVTSGIVSALHRPVTTGDSEDDLSYINAVQTDAAINPGNSGGPLVNLVGQVVGVNSAIATNGTTRADAGNIGVGFAIPIEQVRVTAAQILASGEARYPVIGARVQTGEEGGDGAEIVDVESGTPAADAGLRKGDLIVAVDQMRVTDGIGLIVAIRTHQPGETVTFTVRRGDGEREVELTLGGQVG